MASTNLFNTIHIFSSFQQKQLDIRYSHRAAAFQRYERLLPVESGNYGDDNRLTFVDSRPCLVSGRNTHSTINNTVRFYFDVNLHLQSQSWCCSVDDHRLSCTDSDTNEWRLWPLECQQWLADLHTQKELMHDMYHRHSQMDCRHVDHIFEHWCMVQVRKNEYKLWHEDWWQWYDMDSEKTRMNSPRSSNNRG